jgi:hypothetical protein
MSAYKRLLRCGVGILFCGLAAPGLSLAQGTISDGAVSMSFDAAGAGNTLSVGGTDHLFYTHWWHRIAPAVAETEFPALSAQSYVGNVATLDWFAMGATGNLFAQLVVTINEAGGGATVTQELTLTHVIPQAGPEGGNLDFQIFGYTDFDLANTIGDDSATLLVANSQMEITDPTDVSAFYLGADAIAYKVTPFPDLANELTDAGTTNLDNSGLPFGPGDFTGGYQWAVNLAPQASTTILSTYEISFGGPSVLEIPTLSPAGLALLFLGFAGLAVLQLRRRARG